MRILRPSFSLALALLVMGLSGCDSGSVQRACLAVAEAALEVEVIDSTSGRYIAANADGILTDQSYRDSLRHGTITQREPTLIVKTLVGGFERAGTYDVRIEHPDYQVWTRSDVEVPAGECGPETQYLEAELRKPETGR